MIKYYIFVINILLKNEYFWFVFFYIYVRIVFFFYNLVYLAKCEWKLCRFFRVKVFNGSILIYFFFVFVLFSDFIDYDSFIGLYIFE